MPVMKVYSWKTLLITILFGGGAIICEFENIMAGVSVKLIPSQKWVSIVLVIVGLLYHLWESLLVQKHMKMERRKYF